ncbi:MAG TPA: CBS domain-containing protein [Spirochaetales bacterium]|nr:CBS domain-containing protein [Spirochaetales bacterium]
MKIIVGHSNMDLDCIGSLVLAQYLFPDHVPLRSHLMQPAARNLMNLYADRLDFPGIKDIKGEKVERVVVVDARSEDRIAEVLPLIEPGTEIEVFDHHPPSGREIPGATVHGCSFGANASQLCRLLAGNGIGLDPEDATIALTGIYADTGNFTHSNVCREDFNAAAFLLEQGASLKLVKDFLVPLKERNQVVLFHEVLAGLESRTIRGHVVQTCYMELEEDSQGLGAVVERVFEVENGEILLGFFFFKPKGKALIIGRNGTSDVRLNEVLADFGGGGHAQAASATVRTENGRELYERFLGYLERALRPAATAWDIMTEEVEVLGQEDSLLDASLFFERTMHTGAPVVDAEGNLSGIITLRDILKGRKAGQMKAPVRTYMSRNVVTAAPDSTVRQIDDLLFRHNIGHLPVVVDRKVVGIVTRTDFLEYKHNERRKKDQLLKEFREEA